jgi:hypothetical protein
VSALKKCLDCGILKALDDFPAAKKRTDGRGSYCTPCMNERSKVSYRRRQAAQGKSVRDRVNTDAMKFCPDCETLKPREDFPRSKNKKDGLGGYCKSCHNLRTKATVERLYGSARHFHLKRRYGISAAEVDAMIRAQGGLCLVCRERPAEHVDHDHLTGAVRGVLCFSCNGGLGQFRDRVDIMTKAITYLERTTWQKTLERPGVYRLTSPRPAPAASATSSLLPRPTSSRRGCACPRARWRHRTGRRSSR